jgi:hypothetical protein
MNEHISITSQAEKFAGLVNAGVNSWTEAGKLLVGMLALDPDAFKKITTLYPAISLEMLGIFERIGRKLVYPYLLLDNSPGCQRLLELPYENQVEIYKSGVDVVTGLKPKTMEPMVERKRVQQLTSYDANLVFSDGELRSVDRQASIKQMAYGSVVPKKRNREIDNAHVKTFGAYRIVIKGGVPQLKKEEKYSKIKMVVYIKPELSQSDSFEIKEK